MFMHHLCSCLLTMFNGLMQWLFFENQLSETHWYSQVTKIILELPCQEMHETKWNYELKHNLLSLKVVEVFQNLCFFKRVVFELWLFHFEWYQFLIYPVPQFQICINLLWKQTHFAAVIKFLRLTNLSLYQTELQFSVDSYWTDFAYSSTAA